MKTNLLTSRGLKLGIFSLALAIPTLSAQAQKYPLENNSIIEAERLGAKSAEILSESKIYPKIQDMVDGGLFTDETRPTAEQVGRVRAIRQQVEGQIKIINGGIKKLESKGDHPVLNELKKQKEELESTLASLEKRLGEFERRGQNLYDQMSDEARKKFEENLINKASTIDKLMGSIFQKSPPDIETGVDNTAPKLPATDVPKEDTEDKDNFRQGN